MLLAHTTTVEIVVVAVLVLLLCDLRDHGAPVCGTVDEPHGYFWLVMLVRFFSMYSANQSHLRNEESRRLLSPL